MALFSRFTNNIKLKLVGNIFALHLGNWILTNEKYEFHLLIKNKQVSGLRCKKK